MEGCSDEVEAKRCMKRKRDKMEKRKKTRKEKNRKEEDVRHVSIETVC